MKTFLLRFEEALGAGSSVLDSPGKTPSQTHQQDGSSQTVAAGTKTLTEVGREASDKDRAAQILFAFPR